MLAQAIVWGILSLVFGSTNWTIAWPQPLALGK